MTGSTHERPPAQPEWTQHAARAFTATRHTRAPRRLDCPVSTKRCTAAERAAIIRWVSHTDDVPLKHQGGAFEPALGTLAQRLDILIKRHGGRLRPPRPTEAELALITREEIVA